MRWAIVLIACAALEGSARATCDPNVPQWSAGVATGAASAAPSDTSFNPQSQSISYVVSGNELYAIRNTGTMAGTALWAVPVGSSGTVQNFPYPTIVDNGTEAIFLAGTDGYLYRFNAANGMQQWAVDTRRSVCASDQVIATPTVQLKRFSTNFTPTDDIVIVITHDGCNDTTDNRILAYHAMDGSVAWRFNYTKQYWMDFGSEGCSIDYGANAVYCGTNLPIQHTQNTLWAISTNDGSRLWSVLADGIRSRPQLGLNNRLYVATYGGTLRVFNPTNGSELWHLALTSSANVTRNVWPELRPSSGYAGTILVSDTGGYLYSVADLGSSGSLSWKTNLGSAVSTMPGPSPFMGKIFVGTNNGIMHQINFSTGANEASATVGTGTVFDPTFDVEQPANDINRITVAAYNGGTARLRRFCIPWAQGAMGTMSVPVDPTPYACTPPPGFCCGNGDCTSTQCTNGICEMQPGDIYGVCTSIPVANGTVCSDGLVCTTGDNCQSGVCTPTDHSACTCTNVGDSACAAGLDCCGAAGCVNLLTDPSNCGLCGRNCTVSGVGCSAGDCTCVAGACQRKSEATLCPLIADAARLTAVVPTLPGGNAIDYSSSCDAYLALAHKVDAAPSGTVKVPGDPAMPPVTNFNPGGIDSPDSGVAVFKDAFAWSAALLNELGAPGPAPSGFQWVQPGGGPFNSDDTAAHLTMGAEPFVIDPGYNNGPSGPALNQKYYDASGKLKVYFGNWTSDTPVSDVPATTVSCTFAGGCSFVTGAALFTAPSRITALGYTVIKPVGDGVLVAGYADAVGAKLIIHCDADTNTAACAGGIGPKLYDASGNIGLDLNGADYTGAAQVLYIGSERWIYGDVPIVVRATDGKISLLLMRSDDLSLRNYADVQNDLHVTSNLISFGWSYDARVGVARGLIELLQMPSFGGTPGFTDVGIYP
jgi:hypothetical protein